MALLDLLIGKTLYLNSVLTATLADVRQYLREFLREFVANPEYLNKMRLTAFGSSWRDNTDMLLIGVAGNQMLVQGNQKSRYLALNHSATSFFW